MDDPSEKVKLAYRRLNHRFPIIQRVVDSQRDTIPSAKWVKVLLGECFQLGLITLIDIK
jgi:hypothetical protein